MTNRNIDIYVDELHTALELRGAQDDHIADVIRQVQSHLIDTGEDPYEAFGDPRDYAQQHAPHSSPVRLWSLIVISVALTVVGGWLLVNGLINLVGERLILWGVSPLWGIVVGSLLIVAWVVTLTSVGAGRRARIKQRA